MTTMTAALWVHIAIARFHRDFNRLIIVPLPYISICEYQ